MSIQTDTTEFTTFARGRFYAIRHVASDRESADSYEDRVLAAEGAAAWNDFAKNTTKKFLDQAVRQNFGR
jgi:hypothetical protein